MSDMRKTKHNMRTNLLSFSMTFTLEFDPRVRVRCAVWKFCFPRHSWKGRQDQIVSDYISQWLVKNHEKRIMPRDDSEFPALNWNANTMKKPQSLSSVLFTRPLNQNTLAKYSIYNHAENLMLYIKNTFNYKAIVLNSEATTNTWQRWHLKRNLFLMYWRVF